ncbi:MAG TPA: nuclear transport factor 2 family protein [Gemmatimonadaceae bacterium]|nr:nuclear transport factor 2 family protein [Gemmatimonadaceae bacterium]
MNVSIGGRSILLSVSAVVLAAAIVTAPARASAAPASTRLDTVHDSGAVAETVQRFHDALRQGDSTGALALLAPDAVVLESGDTESLAEYRAHHLPADIAFAQAVRETRSAIRVTVRGDAAWAVSTTSVLGTFRTRSVNSAGAELMVLSRTPTGWVISAIHWSSRAKKK